MVNIKIKLFADGANLADIKALALDPRISGFTTNPSLMRAAKVENYQEFASEVLAAVPNHPVSFEILSDEPRHMVRQAHAIAKWGKNVYVKIPICNTKGVSNRYVIEDCIQSGIKVNVTAVFTLTQVRFLTEVLDASVPSIVSIFAGRIADTGIDPMPTMISAKRTLHGTGAQLLWASTREIYNIFQAEKSFVDIITVSHALLRKLSLLGKDLILYSQETSQEFYLDAHAAGYRVGSVPDDHTPATEVAHAG